MCNSIEVKSAYKSYVKDGDENFVLKGLNMHVKIGQIYSLIGASACGKTTLLQCILGMKPLNSGSINVLGHSVSAKVNKVSHKIGYMPQNSELTPELTIKETLEYFGNVFQMNREVLKSRYEMIHELLELPCGDQKVQELSGGQTRRVSLAVAIIHDPLILILDEPTVGLDAILREKIWNFLMFTTQTTNLSVVITTHYISEAMQSDCVGLMRDGRLLAEDTPNNINSSYGTLTLDEAFLKLCLSERSGNELQFVPQIDDFASEVEINEVKKDEFEVIEKRKNFNNRTMSALVKKEFIRIKRQPSEIIFMTLFPIVQVLLFGCCIGGFPIGLKLGVVNHEVPNFSQCSLHLQNQSSHIQYASCDFLSEITDDIAIKVFYDSHDEAYRDAKRNKITGFVEISPHFTDIMLQTKLEEKEDNHHLGRYGIDVHMDQTDLQIMSFLQYRLYKAYESFNMKLLRRCGLNENLENIPMKFEKPIYGSFMSDFKNSMAPPTIMQIAFFNSVAFTSFSVAQNRRGGFWNRTVLAGVTPLEILVVQILTSFLVVFISVTETVVLAFYLIDITIIGNGLTLIIILFMTCAAGSFCGILLSTVSDDIKFVSMFTLTFGQIISVLCGAVWPLEAQHWFVRYFSYLLPVTLPSISMRDVMIRGYELLDNSVVIGISVLLVWIAGTLFFSFVVIRKRKFSEM